MSLRDIETTGATPVAPPIRRNRQMECDRCFMPIQGWQTYGWCHPCLEEYVLNGSHRAEAAQLQRRIDALRSQAIHLTHPGPSIWGRTPADILDYLRRRTGQIVGQRELQTRVYGDYRQDRAALMRVHVSRVRRERLAIDERIESVRYQGWRLVRVQGES